MHDVMVIGAGPAGAAAAVHLVDAGCSVLVLERDALDPGPDITSGEVLAPMTQHECGGIGVELAGDWVHDRFEAVRTVYPDLSWTLHPFPEGFFYLHVDRGGFNAALRRRVQAVGADLRCGTKVTDVEVLDDSVVVRTLDGGEHRGRVLVDAAGRTSPTVRRFGLKRADPEFHQLGVALFFSAFDDVVPHTWDRHLYGDHGAMVSGSRIRPGLYRWILEADLADKQDAHLRPVEFYESVVARFDPWLHERLVAAPRVGQPWSMAPIGFSVDEVARDRVVLAGDAAGYLSPITGQGMEFAMRMGRLAAASVVTALATGDTSASAFAPYVEGRRREVEQQMDLVRLTLRWWRDREALLRAAHDDDFRVEVFGPLGAMVAERGSLMVEHSA